MAISRFAASRLTQGLPKYQSAWDQDGVQQGALVPINRLESNGTISSFAFSSIPQDYKDLIIIVEARSNWATYTTFSLYFNGTGSTGWSQTFFTATTNSTSAVVSSTRQVQSGPTYGFLIDATSGITNANVFGTAKINIMDYASTTRNKTVIGQGATEDGSKSKTELNVATWANTSAVTTIEVATNGNWIPGSNATLYGVKAGA